MWIFPYSIIFLLNSLAKYRTLDWKLASHKILKVFLSCLLGPNVTEIIQILIFSLKPGCLSLSLSPCQYSSISQVYTLMGSVSFHYVRHSVCKSLLSANLYSPDLLIFWKLFYSWLYPFYGLFSLFGNFYQISWTVSFLFPPHCFLFICFFTLVYARIVDFVF